MRDRYEDARGSNEHNSRDGLVGAYALATRFYEIRRRSK